MTAADLEWCMHGDPGWGVDPWEVEERAQCDDPTCCISTTSTCGKASYLLLAESNQPIT